MSIRVGIIDDSVTIRLQLKKAIESDPRFEVIWTARDAYEARKQIFQDEPDVLTLDIELPEVDGLTFLDKIMEYHPVPVIMVSRFTQENSREGVLALRGGAFDIVSKPAADTEKTVDAIHEELREKLKAAVEAQESSESDRYVPSRSSVELPEQRYDAVLIGSSTGGVDALERIFESLQADLPPIFVVQHMPRAFTEKFSSRLDEISAVNVSQARDRQRISKGEAVIAPGGRHLLVDKYNSRGQVRLRLTDSEPINSSKPSVDKLFYSAADAFEGDRVLVVVLTGMGKDGRRGAMRLDDKTEATILTQDESSSVVYGMPRRVREAIDGSIEISLEDLAATINRLEPK